MLPRRRHFSRKQSYSKDATIYFRRGLSLAMSLLRGRISGHFVHLARDTSARRLITTCSKERVVKEPEQNTPRVVSPSLRRWKAEFLDRSSPENRQKAARAIAYREQDAASPSTQSKHCLTLFLSPACISHDRSSERSKKWTPEKVTAKSAIRFKRSDTVLRRNVEFKTTRDVSSRVGKVALRKSITLEARKEARKFPAERKSETPFSGSERNYGGN